MDYCNECYGQPIHSKTCKNITSKGLCLKMITIEGNYYCSEMNKNNSTCVNFDCYIGGLDESCFFCKNCINTPECYKKIGDKKCPIKKE